MDINEALIETQKLLNAYGLTDWKAKSSRMVRCFGWCDYSKKTIALSKALVELNTKEEVAKTIIHELAHALTPGDHHGKKWVAMCERLGIFPYRCYDNPTRNVVRVKAKYDVVCPAHGRVTGAFRASKRIHTHVNCGQIVEYKLAQ